MYSAVQSFVEQYVPARFQRPAKQLVKFAATGCIGAAVDFSIYNLLTRGLGWRTILTVLGFPLIAANLVSVGLAITGNFLLNKYWTFRDPSARVVQQWGGYVALSISTFLLNQVLTSFFAFRFPLIEAIFLQQKDNAAKALAIGIIMTLNFMGSKFIVFRGRRPH